MTSLGSSRLWSWQKSEVTGSGYWEPNMTTVLSLMQLMTFFQSNFIVLKFMRHKIHPIKMYN